MVEQPPEERFLGNLSQEEAEANFAKGLAKSLAEQMGREFGGRGLRGTVSVARNTPVGVVAEAIRLFRHDYRCVNAFPMLLVDSAFYSLEIHFRA